MAEQKQLVDAAREVFAPGWVDAMQGIGHGKIMAARQGATVTDTDGRQYLDAEANGGSCLLGHRPGELIAALHEAAYATDQGNFPMISREKAALAQALAKFAPTGLECSVFGVMRGEAMDAACKIARGYTERRKLVTVDGAWYGETGFALSLSQREDAADFGPLIPEIAVVPLGDIAAAEKALDGAAAMIVEPLQLDNHARPASTDYLLRLRKLCTKTGALLIVDETHTAFGRSGGRFYCELAGITPDILLVGEALGGGVFPITATLLTQQVNSFLNRRPMIHLSTFGGSDVGCMVANKALDLYTYKRPWHNAARIGKVLVEALAEQVGAYGDLFEGVAGMGLAISLRMHDATRVSAFCRRLADNGVLARPARVDRNCVVFTPPLTIDEGEAGAIAEAIGKAAAQLREAD